MLVYALLRGTTLPRTASWEFFDKISRVLYKNSEVPDGSWLTAGYMLIPGERGEETQSTRRARISRLGLPEHSVWALFQQ